MAGMVASPPMIARAVSVLPKPPKLRQPVTIHQHMIGRQGHRQQRAAHGEKCGLQDIQGVDLRPIRPADAETQRIAANDRRSSGVRSSGRQDLGIRDAVDGRPGRKITAAATTGPARGPRPASSMPATRRLTAIPSRASRDFTRFEDRLRRARTRVAAQVGVNPRELTFQGGAAFGIVKPHQELRSDRLRDNFLLKILADDAPIRK